MILVDANILMYAAGAPDSGPNMAVVVPEDDWLPKGAGTTIMSGTELTLKVNKGRQNAGGCPPGTITKNWRLKVTRN